ncbi:MAG: histidine phosphatase family protein [Phaeodactylibacter sp.]|nr:histidine phosphatase family protein [Phaeodactylibacter sp.]MCB9266067.1 histidine phosphatase family protein [Lewinellaceae bacterium]MCB9289388.1 histidine phosphatase family protein [Lewinellaceae bacterium]
MKKDIYIIRHGETEYNRMGIVQGQGVDTSLNELGRRQARAFYEHYKDTGFEVVLTSRLRRTHETVSPFIGQGLPWEQFAEINEIAWGEHEGKKSTPEMMQQYREVTDAWKRGEYDARLEGAESASSLANRITRFIEHLRGRPENTLLVCSHGRAMRCLMCLLRGQPLQNMDNFHHSNTGLYQVQVQSGTFHFLLENDLSHLETAGLKLA